MGTLVCTVEMDKTAGLTVTILNDGDQITQTIKMNGTTIELKVVAEKTGATSTVTQSAEKVSVACRQFEVNAEETVVISSGKGSTYKSDDTMTIQSASGMTIKSDTTIDGTGQSAVNWTGGGSSKLELAAGGAKLSGANVDLTGQAQLSGNAPSVALKSDATLSLESSGVATLKGSMTTVTGGMVSVG